MTIQLCCDDGKLYPLIRSTGNVMFVRPIEIASIGPAEQDPCFGPANTVTRVITLRGGAAFQILECEQNRKVLGFDDV